MYIYIYCLYIPVLWLKQETFTDSLNQRKAQSGFFLSVQYFICLSQIGSAEIKDTHLHVQNFINKAHFSQKLIFFANKIFGYFDFCIFFFLYNINCYVSTSEFYIPHCFVYIPCMTVVIPCSVRIKIIYIHVYTFISFPFTITIPTEKKKWF